MQTLESTPPAGFKPEPMSTRIFIRCYRSYRDAKRAYDQLRVVAHIPDQRMTVVARGLEWREPVTAEALLKFAGAIGASLGGCVGLVLWLFGFTGSTTSWLSQTILAAVAGVAVGLAAAVIVARVRAPRTGLVETGHVQPRQYDILVEEDVAPVAREVLEVD